jgi:hypothetical protein
MCQLQLQAGPYNKGYRRTTGSPYYGPKITSGSTGGATLGWLLEPEKKNLLTNSMNMSSSGLSSATGWTLSRTGITWTTDILCPAGFSDGYQLFDTTDNATHRIVSDGIPLQFSIYNATGFSMYTASAFVKSGGITNAWLQIGDQSETAFARAVFNIENFTVGASLSQNGITMIPSMAGLERYNDGWARIYMTALVGTGSTMRVMYGLSNSSSNVNVSYAGTGTGFIYIWGPQFETGYFPTTYMPSGNCTANSFTLRSANTAIMGLTGNSIYAVPEFGTVYCSYYMRNYVFPNAFPRIVNLTLAASNPINSVVVQTNNTPSAYNGFDYNVNSTGPGSAGLKSMFAYRYWNTSSAISPPVYNKLYNSATSFLGLSGASAFAWMALNGQTASTTITNSGVSFGGTFSIPLNLDFNNRTSSNPDGHPAFILKSYSFVPQFTDQNILVQRTT